jgi:hypothetical protein
VILGVVATGITFRLTYRIIAAEGATNAATVGYLLPVVSVALGQSCSTSRSASGSPPGWWSYSSGSA